MPTNNLVQTAYTTNHPPICCTRTHIPLGSGMAKSCRSLFRCWTWPSHLPRVVPHLPFLEVPGPRAWMQLVTVAHSNQHQRSLVLAPIPCSLQIRQCSMRRLVGGTRERRPTPFDTHLSAAASHLAMLMCSLRRRFLRCVLRMFLYISQKIDPNIV